MNEAFDELKKLSQQTVDVDIAGVKLTLPIATLEDIGDVWNKVDELNKTGKLGTTFSTLYAYAVWHQIQKAGLTDKTCEEFASVLPATADWMSIVQKLGFFTEEQLKMLGNRGTINQTS